MANEISPVANAENSQNKRRSRVQSKYQKRFSKPGALVTFLIGKGDNAEKFTVHKEFACRVKAFNAAFNSNFFVEGQTQTYRIEDTSVDAFRLFVQQLYGQGLDLFQLRGDYEHTWGTTTQEERDENHSLIELWVLAEKYEMYEIQNATMNCILAIYKRSDCVCVSEFPYIYNNTCSGSPLRKLVVAQCTWKVDITEMVGLEDLLPHEMLFEIAIFAQKTMIPTPGRGDFIARELYLSILIKDD